MSIPLDRLYHYIESVAQDVYGDTVIYHFYPHGSKKISDLKPLHHDVNWAISDCLPDIYCHDQEPLNYDYYQNINIFDIIRLLDDYKNINSVKLSKSLNTNIRVNPLNIYDRCILIHSEQRSLDVTKYQLDQFIPVYYWSHALIALDWFRYAKHIKPTKTNLIKKFLIYNRAWSGTREYRLKFADLLVENNLVNDCQTSCNLIDPELNIDYRQHTFVNPDFIPNHNLACFDQNNALSHYSADFNINDYNSTEFEIVLETLFDDRRLHLTEKVFRPIACKQPFLLAGTAGSLSYLHSYGFKTFDGIINEEYDSIEDPLDRLKAIIQEMQSITKWTAKEQEVNQQKIKDIVDYNHSWFFSAEFFNLIVNELRKNLTQALNELEQSNTSSRYLEYRKIIAENAETKQFITVGDSYRSRKDILTIVARARSYYNQYYNKY